MIIPAILATTKEELKTKLYTVRNHVKLVQIDVMDGTLTQNSSFWDPQELEQIKTSLHYEFHLMVKNPLLILPRFSALPNVQRVYVHLENNDDLYEIIKQARYYGFEIGIVLNNETPINEIKNYLKDINGVMFMGVHPGAGGQTLLHGVIKKIKEFHNQYPDTEIEVDGGVTNDTIREIKNAGVTRFAVGSAIFESENPELEIKKLQNILNKNSSQNTV